MTEATSDDRSSAERMDIAEWFDPHSRTHLRAYQTMEKTGSWPEGFVPDSVTHSEGWRVRVEARLHELLGGKPGVVGSGEPNRIPIADWFDPHNPAHLRAYRVLDETGAWPDGFIPEDVELSGGWHGQVIAKCGHAWMSLKLGDASEIDEVAQLPVNPTDEQVADACMWHSHDFGLKEPDDRKRLMFRMREHWRAIWKSCQTPGRGAEFAPHDNDEEQ